MKLKTEEEMRQLRKDSTKESSIEGYFLRQAKRYGCRQRKITPFYGPDGWPDRLLVWPDGRGTTDWVELKRPKGGIFQPKQEQVHEDLRSCGALVMVISTRELVDAYLKGRAKQLGVKPVVVAKRPRARLLEAAEFVRRL